MLRESIGAEEARKQVDRCLHEIQTHLLEGIVVPFLGAGISNACEPQQSCSSGACTSPPPDACESRRQDMPAFKPTADSLKQSLAKWLWNQCQSSPDTAERAGKLLDVQDLHCLDQREFIGRLSSAEPATDHGRRRVSLDRLAEVCVWLSDPRTVCRVLRIDRFTTLEPRPVHRYIAYLVREGLVDEIVTTNWDTCIETALTRSFGPRRTARLDLDTVGESSPFRVIRQIDEYRRWGASRRRGRGRRQPVLRLYKINGCAAAYERDPAGEAERIALTERQLQGFRDNHWAADLFRDRARSHRFLFSGFGSSEPQIRHAVTALASEFRAFPVEAREATHAPFVHVYDESPSFHQYQLLRAYYSEQESDLRVGMTRAVTAAHADWFPDPRRPEHRRAPTDRGQKPVVNRLDADHFWFGVYLVAVRGLVERYCEPPFPFHAWLARCGTAPVQKAMRLRRWLYPHPDDDGHACSTPSEVTFGRLATLFRPVASAETHGGWPYDYLGPGPMRLWVWLAGIQGRRDPISGSGCPHRDWYLPMREASLLILSSLYVLMALVPDLSADKVDPELPSAKTGCGGTNGNAPARERCVWPEAGGVGLRVRVSPETGRISRDAGSEDAHTPFDVVIVDHGAPNPPTASPKDDMPTHTTICYQLAVSNRGPGGGLVRTGRWERRAKPHAARRTLRAGKFVRLPAEEVVLADEMREVRAEERPAEHRIRAVRLAAARLLPRTRARLVRRAAHGVST